MFLKQCFKIISCYMVVHADDSSSCGSKQLFIHGGKVVNADKTQKLDILIENGCVKELGKNLKAPANARIISADSMYVIPGGIDPHTHLEFEFMGTVSQDDFHCGTRAAIAGGTTTIIDFAICKPQQSLIDVYEQYRVKADGNVCCDYSLHVGITWWSNEVANEMETLCNKLGVNSFKVFMAYKDLFMVDDSQLYEVLKKTKEIGGLGMVHAENGHIISKNMDHYMKNGITEPEGHQKSHTAESEAEATNRAGMISKQLESPLYVVHVMSKQAADVIAKRRSEGQFYLYGETLVSAVGTTFPKACNFDLQAGHVMSPALREEPYHSDALITHLKNNVIQTTGSDNCTFNKEQKRIGKLDFAKIPNGVNGLEDRMAVIWEKAVHSGKMNVEKFVAITSTNAAKIFNLYPKKGCIQVGSDADIVIWNPKKERCISAETHHHRNDFNIFEGMTVHGSPEVVIVKGEVCYEKDKVKAIKGHGKFLCRKPFPEFIYCNMEKK